jgi:hypothetical protein
VLTLRKGHACVLLVPGDDVAQALDLRFFVKVAKELYDLLRKLMVLSLSL